MPDPVTGAPTVAFPLASAGLPGAPAPRTVLVVDDEKNIRRTLQLVLEGEGYHVLGAETAEAGARDPGEPGDPRRSRDPRREAPGHERPRGARARSAATRRRATCRSSSSAGTRRCTTRCRPSSSARATSSRSRSTASASSSASTTSLDAAQGAAGARASVAEQQLQRYEMIGTSAADAAALPRASTRSRRPRRRVLITGESGTGKELIAAPSTASARARTGRS